MAFFWYGGSAEAQQLSAPAPAGPALNANPLALLGIGRKLPVWLFFAMSWLIAMSGGAV